MTATWSLQTERLVLRPVAPDDLDAIWAYRSIPEVGRWLGGSRDRADFDRRFLEPKDGRTQLTVLLEGRIAGDVMLQVRDGWSQRAVTDQAESTEGVLGWTFSPGFRGRGLATEAVRELIRHAFEDLGLRRVTADCFAENERSWRLMERVGMRREAHHVSNALHRDLGWQDQFVYALLAEEWGG